MIQLRIVVGILGALSIVVGIFGIRIYIQDSRERFWEMKSGKLIIPDLRLKLILLSASLMVSLGVVVIAYALLGL